MYSNLRINFFYSLLKFSSESYGMNDENELETNFVDLAKLHEINALIPLEGDNLINKLLKF